MAVKSSDASVPAKRQRKTDDSDRTLPPGAGIALGLILSLFCWTVLIAGAVLIAEFL